MKQGKTEKAVFAKLSKVELEEQKVELSIGSQIANYADDISTIRTKLQGLLAANSKVKRLFALKEDAIQLTKELESARAEQNEKYVGSWVKDVPQLLNEIEQSVKDLGVDPSNVKGYNEIKKAYTTINSSYKLIEGVGAAVTRELGRKI